MNHINKTNRKLNIAELLIVIALIVFIVLMITSNNTKDVDMETIKAELISDSSISEMTEKTALEMETELGVDLTDVEVIAFEADDVMDVSRLYVFKTEDADKMQEIIDAVDESIESDANDFNGYGTNQYDLLTSADKLEKGNYYFACVSEDADKWQDEFLDTLK